MQKKKIHESVLVGYFCQAVGWVARDLDSLHNPSDTQDLRMMRAINLSHNPLDPAIGDMILQLDDEERLPKEFYIFEFKVDWKKGINDELAKFRSKHQGAALTVEAAGQVLKEFPEVDASHFYGALLPIDGGRNVLCAHPYWKTLLGHHSRQIPTILSTLLSIAVGTAKKGLTLERLVEYVARINSDADEGSMASTGSARFAVAFDEYQMYTFNLDSLLEYQLEKQHVLEQRREMEAEKRRARERGPSLGR